MNLVVDVPRPENAFVGALVMATLHPGLKSVSHRQQRHADGERFYINTAGRSVELPLGHLGSIVAAEDGGRVQVTIPRVLWTLGHAAGLDSSLVQNSPCPRTGAQLVWLPKNAEFAIPVSGVGELVLKTE